MEQARLYIERSSLFGINVHKNCSAHFRAAFSEPNIFACHHHHHPLHHHHHHHHICHGVGPLIDPFQSQVSTSLFSMSTLILSARWGVVFHYPG